jgi:retron-type reverse transcriptase
LKRGKSKSFSTFGDEWRRACRPSPRPADNENMQNYERICDFKNLYKAHLKTRRGKQGNTEVIAFEMNLAANLCDLQKKLAERTYRPSGYYHFTIRRLSEFMYDHYKAHGSGGYVLKCDFRKYFDSIDHEILKRKLTKAIGDRDVLRLLYTIIDSYESSPGKGLPPGNQTSQWFALYYLDSFDRLIKEKLRVKHYTRYMDDCILIHENKEFLAKTLIETRSYAEDILKLRMNDKTQIFPISNGVNYLGFHIYLTSHGKVVRRVKTASKTKFRRALKQMALKYKSGVLNIDDIKRRLSGYLGHLKHGHTYRLRKKLLSEFVLTKE